MKILFRPPLFIWYGRSMALTLFLFVILQFGHGQDRQIPDYNFRVSLPPISQQDESLSLPDLPLYDRDNFYLEVRDSSQDWYNDRLGSEKTQEKKAANLAFTPPPEINDTEPSSNMRRETAGKASLLLDAEKRILPDNSNVLLDESLAPIPPRR